MNKYCSIVIPVYNSEGNLEVLSKKIERVFQQINRKYEIIFVNDFSRDSSWLIIEELSKGNKNIKGINLRRNFGQDSALMAGLKYVSGEYIIIMDDDLQHNPDDIPSLIRELEKGFDVCYALFKNKNQTLLKNFGSWFNGKVANIMINKPKEIYLSPFKAFKAEIAKELFTYDGPYPYLDGFIFRTTRNITQIPIQHLVRYSGIGNYNLTKSIKVWLKLFTNFSVKPLRIATYCGFISATIGFIIGMYFILKSILGEVSPGGWASTITIVIFLGGVQLITLGMIGEYIGRMFLYINKSPQYIIKDKINLNIED